ncbi:MAG TPA: hypothetical protein VN426_06020 [Syntrophomonadaceae bacterium]|nr:hypothetical protein [Syntrophomonadaceae bacterium]
MKPSESVCFATDKIEALNDLATQIDERLFLFAYYEPKPWPEKESARTRFYTAIVNLYGLFWDCGPFVRTRLMVDNMYHPQDSILPKGADLQDLRKTISGRFVVLIEVISAFRSIICHNNSSVFYFNGRMQDAAVHWCDEFCGIWRPLADLESCDWKKMLDVLISQMRQVAEDMEFCLNDLIRLIPSRNYQLNKTIDQWLLYGIGGWYRYNHELLLNAMAEFYMLFIGTEEKGAMTGAYDQDISLRQNVKNWLAVHFGTDSRQWQKQWLEQGKMKTVFQHYCPRPALPDEFFKILANDVYSFSLRNALG